MRQGFAAKACWKSVKIGSEDKGINFNDLDVLDPRLSLHMCQDGHFRDPLGFAIHEARHQWRAVR